MRLSLAAVCSLVAVLASTPVRAAPDATKEAETLFTSGREAMTRGDLQAACSRFAESLKLHPAVGTLLNLAACEDRSNRLVLALEHFTEARSQLPKDDFRIAFTTEQIERLSRRVARITLRVAPDPPSGTRVLRDGAEVPAALWNAPVTVDPGAHTLVIEAPSRAAATLQIALAEGEAKTVDLVAPSLSSAAPPVADRPDQATNSRKTLGFVALGVGVLGLAVGAVSGLAVLNAASTYRGHCPGGQCDSEGLSAASTGKTMSVVSPVALVLGAIGVGTGTHLLVTSKHAPAASGAPAGLHANVSPTGAGVTFATPF